MIWYYWVFRSRDHDNAHLMLTRLSGRTPTSSPGRFSRPAPKAREKRPGDEVGRTLYDFKVWTLSRTEGLTGVYTWLVATSYFSRLGTGIYFVPRWLEADKGRDHVRTLWKNPCYTRGFILQICRWNIGEFVLTWEVSLRSKRFRAV